MGATSSVEDGNLSLEPAIKVHCELHWHCGRQLSGPSPGTLHGRSRVVSIAGTYQQNNDGTGRNIPLHIGEEVSLPYLSLQLTGARHPDNDKTDANRAIHDLHAHTRYRHRTRQKGDTSGSQSPISISVCAFPFTKFVLSIVSFFSLT